MLPAVVRGRRSASPAPALPIAVALLFVILASLPTADAATIVVDDDGGPWADATTVQAGIDMASEGDLVVVCSGNYTEHVKVALSVTIVGNGSATVTGNLSLPTFDVLADGVTLRALRILATDPRGTGVNATDADGLMLENCTIDAGATSVRTVGGSLGISGCDLRGDIVIASAESPSLIRCNVTGGVLLISSPDAFIVGCHLEDSSANATLLVDSPRAQISMTTVESADAAGIMLLRSGDSALENVTSRDNGLGGIAIRNSSFVLVSAALIEGNGGPGVLLAGRSAGCVVRRSRIADNLDHGARASVAVMPPAGYENVFHHNAFVGNLLNVTQAYDDGEGVLWYQGAEGNHWSDHPGIDENGDGIADTPYEVAGGDAEDGFPLVSAHDIANDVPAATIGPILPQTAYLDTTVSFNGTATDEDGHIRIFLWISSIDGVLHRGPEPSFLASGFGPGNHTVSLTVKDDEGTWSHAVTSWLVVENRTTPIEPPIAMILYAGPNLTMHGERVRFRGTGETAGNITRFRWRSDIDGPLYAGPSFEFSSTELSNGTHRIFLAVRDDAGLWSDEASANMTVNGRPDVLGASAAPYPAADDEPVTLDCEASDDGALERYVWTSSISGEVYNGSSPEWTVDPLPPGDHLLTVRVLDDLGAWSAPFQVGLLVNARPSAAISFPEEGMLVSGIILLNGIAEDADGDVLTVEVALDEGAWTEVLPGTWNLTVDTKELADGDHVVTVRASDGVHSSGEVSVHFTVDNRKQGTGDRPAFRLPRDFPTWLGIAVAITGVAAFLLSGLGTYIALSLLFPLYSKLREETIADQHTRGRMIEYLRHNPGAHYNQIRKDLSLPNGSAVYHLRVLEESGFVRSRNDGFYRRFYPYGFKVPEFALDDGERAILAMVLATPGISQKDLALRMGVSPSTMSHHVKRLRRKGAINASRGSGLRTSPECAEALAREARDKAGVIEGEVIPPAGKT